MTDLLEVRLQGTTLMGFNRRVNAIEAATWTSGGGMALPLYIALDGATSFVSTGLVAFRDPFGIVKRDAQGKFVALFDDNPDLEQLAFHAGTGRLFAYDAGDQELVRLSPMTGTEISANNVSGFSAFVGLTASRKASDRYLYAITEITGTGGKISQLNFNGTESASASYPLAGSEQIIGLCSNAAGDIILCTSLGSGTYRAVFARYDNTMTFKDQVNIPGSEWQPVGSTNHQAVDIDNDGQYGGFIHQVAFGHPIVHLDTDGTELHQWAPSNGFVLGGAINQGGGGDEFYAMTWDTGPDEGMVRVYTETGTFRREWEYRDDYTQPISQSTFYKYPTNLISGKVSLGTPDAGVAIPALDAIDGERLRINSVKDLQAAIGAVCIYWTNPSTDNVYIIPGGGASADNLITKALGSGTDWTFLAAGTRTSEAHVDELEQTIAQLEASALLIDVGL